MMLKKYDVYDVNIKLRYKRYNTLLKRENSKKNRKKPLEEGNINTNSFIPDPAPACFSSFHFRMILYICNSVILYKLTFHKKSSS